MGRNKTKQSKSKDNDKGNNKGNKSKGKSKGKSNRKGNSNGKSNSNGIVPRLRCASLGMTDWELAGEDVLNGLDHYLTGDAGDGAGEWD